MTARQRVLAGLAMLVLLAAAASVALAARAPGRGPGPMMGGGGMGMTPGAMADMQVTSEFGYLTGMIPHHEEAIAAANVLRKGTRRAQMRRFADDIIRTQGAEVAQMKAWLADWYPGRDTGVDYTPMMRDLSQLTADALDRAFLEDMIPHHMMAVMMSQQLLMHDLVEHDPVAPFAARIRDAQRSEIRTMRGWLRSWFSVRGGGMGPGMGGGMGPGMGGGMGPGMGGGMGPGPRMHGGSGR